eukprot:scaffold2204_cov166-Amphora_coffeaeformis.AAC.29
MGGGREARGTWPTKIEKRERNVEERMCALFDRNPMVGLGRLVLRDGKCDTAEERARCIVEIPLPDVADDS